MDLAEQINGLTEFLYQPEHAPAEAFRIINARAAQPYNGGGQQPSAPLGDAKPRKRGPGRPPKASKPKPGPKRIELKAINKRARRHAKALLGIWFPAGLPEHFDIDYRSGEWRIGLTKWRSGMIALRMHFTGLSQKKAALDIQGLLETLDEQLDPAPPPRAAVPEPSLPREKTASGTESVPEATTPRGTAGNLAKALALAKLGLVVFPCRDREEIDPDTGEVFKPKSPHTPNGFKDATTNASTIRKWWRRWPEALVGLPTGKRNKIAVLDLDRKNGKDGFAGIEEIGLDLPDTYGWETPSGGAHRIYAYPLGTDKIACGSDLFKALLGRKETGVDIRGEGGYVIAWSDLTVEIIDSLLEWPVSIEEALRRDKEASEAQYKREHPRQHHEARPDDLERARNALEAIPADHYDDWIKVGMALKAAFGDAGRQLWDAWSGTSTKFDKRAQEKHWRSFKRDGIGLGSLFALAKQSGYQHGRVDCAGSRMNGEFAWQSNDCIDSALSGHSGKNQIEAERSKHFWGDPQTIEAPLHPVPEFEGETLLPAALLEFVMDAADRMPCAPEYVAASVLTAAGSVIGARCAIKPKRFDDWSVVPNLWGGIVGPPSAKKSPAAGEGMKPVDRLIRKAIEAHKEALKGFEAESVIREARQKALQAEIDVAAKKERLSSEPRAKDLGSLKDELLAASAEQDDEPTVRRFRTNDTTVEKLGELLRDNPAGLLVMRDELVGLLSSWDKEGREGDRTFFLEGWNGNAPFDTDRIGRGSILIPNHCVSIFGGIQPDKLIMYLEQASNALANDGMLQRFQMLVYPDPVQWEYCDRVPNQAAREKVYELFATLADFVPTAYGACPADEFNRFPSFQFDDEAQEIYIEWATDLHRKIEREDNQLIAQHLAKYDKLFPALALIFHLMNRATGGSQIAVTRDCALRAAAWCTFLEAHARRCYRLLADNGLRAAQALAAKIQTGALADGFTARDVRLKQWRYLTKMRVLRPLWIGWKIADGFVRSRSAELGLARVEEQPDIASTPRSQGDANDRLARTRSCGNLKKG